MHLVPNLRLAGVVVLLAAMCGAAQAAPPAQNGTFRRDYWYEPGVEHGNPGAQFNSRFRVNDPIGVERFADRPEARANGMMQIRMDENLAAVSSPELYLELWSGHAGTANHRVGINGRGLHPIPAGHTSEGHCTYIYPAIALPRSDLVNGYNALQFACDKGETFWGHFIVDNACLRVRVPATDASIQQAGLAAFSAELRAERRAGNSEQFRVWLEIPEAFRAAVSEVAFEAFYESYDENGDGRTRDWHGFTKDRRPVATLGTASSAPYEIEWNTAMLPAQNGIAVRATVRFHEPGNLLFEASALAGLEIPERKTARVRIYGAADLPKSFWSRANTEKRCTIPLDVPPERIERAELHVVTWAGGAGSVREYFRLNGHFFPVAEGEGHDVQYSVLPVDPGVLRSGDNVIQLLSDTEHHGIEVLFPGPALVVKVREP